MFDNRPEKQRGPLRKLYTLMVSVYNNESTPQDIATEKKMLRNTLRGMGVLSLPFSLNHKKFEPDQTT